MKHVGPRDAGTYTCQGSNIAGTSSDKTVVTIRDAGVKYFNLSDILPSNCLIIFFHYANGILPSKFRAQYFSKDGAKYTM